MNERRFIGVIGLVSMAVLVALITLSPSPVDEHHRGLVNEVLAYLHAHGVPEWFGYGALEFSANIAMFVPFGFFIALLLPLHRWWIAGLAAAAFSACIESVQLMLLPERFASGWDVMANSLGGCVGAGVALLLRVVVAKRDLRLLASARERIGSAAAPEREPEPTAAPR